jgi:hypothetical protein
MTRTGNVVNVETVESTPTIDNPDHHPMACGHVGLSALRCCAQLRVGCFAHEYRGAALLETNLVH